MKAWGLNEEEVKYFVLSDSIVNNAYDPQDDQINILMKDGSLMDLSEASDNLNILALSKPVKKYFLAFPKNLSTK